MARAQVSVTSELLQIAIMKMDLMTDEELVAFTKYPRHEILLSEKVARRFNDESIKSILGNPDQE
ncbi:MAG: hypothetical protein RSG92_27665, partial [Pseudomonas sp.]